MEVQRKVRRSQKLTTSRSEECSRNTARWFGNSFTHESHAEIIQTLTNNCTYHKSVSESSRVESVEYDLANEDELISDLLDASFSLVNDRIVEETPEYGPTGSPVFNESFTIPNLNINDEKNTQEWGDTKENISPEILSSSTSIKNVGNGIVQLHTAAMEVDSKVNVIEISVKPAESVTSTAVPATSTLTAVDRMKLMLQKNAAFGGTSVMQVGKINFRYLLIVCFCCLQKKSLMLKSLHVLPPLLLYRR